MYTSLYTHICETTAPPALRLSRERFLESLKGLLLCLEMFGTQRRAGPDQEPRRPNQTQLCRDLEPTQGVFYREL